MVKLSSHGRILNACVPCCPSPCALTPLCSSRNSNFQFQDDHKRNSSPSYSGSAGWNILGKLCFCLGFCHCSARSEERPRQRTLGSLWCPRCWSRLCRSGTCVRPAWCSSATPPCSLCASRAGARGCSSARTGICSAGGRWHRFSGCQPLACRYRPGSLMAWSWRHANGWHFAFEWGGYGYSGQTPGWGHFSWHHCWVKKRTQEWD